MAVGGRGERPAVTHFELAEPLAGASLLRLKLETGRTHQIRVHLAAIGHPVLGDPLYGVPGGQIGLRRQFLHAARLAFAHPADGHRVELDERAPGRPGRGARARPRRAARDRALRQSRRGGATLREHRDRRDRRGRDGHERRLSPRAARRARAAARQAGRGGRPLGRLGRACCARTTRIPRSSRWRATAASSWPTCSRARAPTRASSTAATWPWARPTASRASARAIEAMRSQGVVVEQLDNAQIRALEPRLAAGVAHDRRLRARRTACASRCSSPTASRRPPSASAPASPSARA